MKDKSYSWEYICSHGFSKVLNDVSYLKNINEKLIALFKKYHMKSYKLSFDDLKTGNLHNLHHKNNKKLFAEFINCLSLKECCFLFGFKKTREKVFLLLRQHGGFHEQYPVSRFLKFKEWRLKVEDIWKSAVPTEEVYFLDETSFSKHGKGCSARMHQEIFSMIDTSENFIEFKKKYKSWSNLHFRHISLVEVS